MTNETIASIKSAIKAVAKSLDLSDYRRRQLQKAELESPAGWGTFPEGDNSDDACIQRYYNAVEAVYSDRVSAGVYTNIILDFKDRLAINRIYA